jgi:hypothetical protein
MSPLGAGLVAGCAGTAALNIVTYGDMALRDRPASQLPAKTVEIVAERLGEQVDENRRQALGALLGYVDGLAFGTAYGALRPYARSVPWPVAGTLLGLATLGPELLSARMGAASDPRTWGLSGWIAGLIPRLAYGLATAAAHEAATAR